MTDNTEFRNISNYKEIIIIATSAPKDRPQYRKDFLKCLSYPNGTHLRFIYRKHWITDTLLQQAKDYGYRLGRHFESKNIKALIVFCEESGTDFNYIPIRFVTLHSISQPTVLQFADIDTYLYVDFELGPFVNLFSDQYTAEELNIFPATTVEERYDFWNSWIHEFDKRPYRRVDISDKNNSIWVFEAANFIEPKLSTNLLQEADKIDELNWERTIQRLSKIHSLKNSLFYKVSLNERLYIEDQVRDGFSKQRRKEVESTFNVYGQKVYKVHSGGTYTILLHSYINSTLSYYSNMFSSTISNNTITLSNPLPTTEGATTETAIVMTCATTYQTQYASLIIAIGKPKENEIAESQLQTGDTEFLLVIKPNRRRLYLVVALVVIGAFTTSFTPDFVNVFKAGWIQANAILISFILKVIGTIVFGISAYLGFGTLPK